MRLSRIEHHSLTVRRKAHAARHGAGWHACLKFALILACLSPLLAFPSGAQASQPDFGTLPKPHPILWRVAMSRVDLVSSHGMLRWNDGNCTDDAATSTCITRVYTVAPDARDVELACSYQYEMQPGYVAAGGGYDTIPMHAPYVDHWPITLQDETANRQIASLWSAQPLGQVYAHEWIKHDSHGRILAKYIHFGNPDLVGCDNENFFNCYWDVLPRHLQVVSAPWHPTPGDHVLRCTLFPPHSAGWFPSPRPISRIMVHVPNPPAQRAPIDTDSVRLGHPQAPVHRAPIGSAVADTHRPSSAAVAAVERQSVTRAPIAPGTVDMHAPLHPLVLAKPKFSIRSARAELAHTCDVGHPARVDFSVANDGGPYAGQGAEYASIRVLEPGGTMNGAVKLPNLAPGQVTNSTLVLGSTTPTGKLPGKHLLVVTVDASTAAADKAAYVTPTPMQIVLNVPAGYCQQRLHVPSAPQMHLNPKPSISMPAASSSPQRQ